ncbi:MAG TPA: biopolymer transporter ExbD [Bryobacteraceae bacterium]|nr:biopolymer transporter ExbD [Bryobacteraceae bacterium]
MAFSPMATTGGRRSRGVAPLAEINVTPFVDVALVLLIIFMITAHVMEYGIDVDVPKTRSVATSTKDLPVVQVSKAGDIYLGKDSVNLHLLARDIRSKYPGQDAVYLRADGEAKFDIVANVMSVLGDAKLHVQVVTQPSDNTSSTSRKR